jgi:outer membrane protein
MRNTFYFATIVVLSVLLTITHTNAQESYSFTIQEAVTYALKNQANVKNAELDTQVAKAKVNELIGLGLPQVDAKVELNRFFDVPTSFFPAEFAGGEEGVYLPLQFGQPYTGQAGFTATQLLFDGSYIAGLQASRAYVELSRKDLTRARIETAIAVSQAYYLVLVNKEAIKEMVTEVERIAKLKDDTKALYENGFVEKMDYDRIVLNYNIANNAKNNITRSIVISENLLKFQMGMDQKANLILTEDIEEISVSAFESYNDTVDYRNRIEYSILKSQYNLSTINVKNFRASRLPSMGLFGSLGWNASRNEFTFFNSEYKWFPSSVVGVQMSMNIFGGFKKNAQVQQAKLNMMKVENSIKVLEDNIDREYQNARASYLNAMSDFDTQKENRELAKELARVSKIKYDTGVGSSLEVIDAESSLRESEANYFQALFNLYTAKLELDRTAGLIQY